MERFKYFMVYVRFMEEYKKLNLDELEHMVSNLDNLAIGNEDIVVCNKCDMPLMAYEKFKETPRIIVKYDTQTGRETTETMDDIFEYRCHYCWQGYADVDDGTRFTSFGIAWNEIESFLDAIIEHNCFVIKQHREMLRLY